MLQEGMNLKGIEVGVITQLDACERGYLQKFGRILRSSEPIVYVLYYENTRDEAFLENVLNGIDKKYIEYEDYD
jgi:superfamily II DNA or RNA helicase